MRLAWMILSVAVGAVLAGCGGSAPTTPMRPQGPVVVTFEAADASRFRALLTDPADIANAEGLLAGDPGPSIPNGRVIRATGVNTGWSWSLDPADFDWAEVTIEGCDGNPSDVEAPTWTSDRYCPWAAKVVAVDPAPAGTDTVPSPAP